MNKIKIIMIILVAILSTCMACNSNNSDKKSYIPDITVDEIDWSINTDIIEQENYVVFKYTNNSKYTITSLKMELIGKENLSEEKKTEFYKAIQKSQGFDDEWMNKWIKSRNELSQPITMYAEAEGEIKATETSDKIKCYYFGGWTSKNVIYNELFVPSKMIIKYIDGDENYTLYYNFDSKIYELESESKSEGKTDNENKILIEESTTEKVVEETASTITPSTTSQIIVPNTTLSTTKNTELDDKKEKVSSVTVQSVNKKQAAVAEAIKQAERWFPTDRHFIEYILVNPSLDEGFDPYSDEEVEYAIANADIEWEKHALYNAIELLEANPDMVSQRDMREFIENCGGYCGCTGYIDAEIQYAIDNCGIDWNDEAIKAMREYWNNDYSVIVTLYDFYEYLLGLGYDDTTIEYALNNTSGYYRGEAMSDEERIKLLLSYGYTREAIINWYSEMMDYSEAEALVDSVYDK